MFLPALLSFAAPLGQFGTPPWPLERTNGICSAGHTVGTGRVAIVAVPGGRPRLTLVLPDWTGFTTGKVDVEVTSIFSNPIPTATADAQPLPDGQPGFSVDPSFLDAFNMVRSFTFSDPKMKRKSPEVHTADVWPAVRRVERCIFEAQQADPGSGAPAVEAPSLVSMTVTGDDYPPPARRAGSSGVVGVSLTVSAAGKVSRCDIEQSVDTDYLDEATCWLFGKRALFTPARDAQGKPTEAVVKKRFRWTNR
jgi:TonB family protein